MRFRPCLRPVFLMCASILCAESRSSAEVRLPSIFSDHMVLQQHSDAPIWGWADPGSSILIRSSWGATARATADASGRWRTSLPTPAASAEPNTIELVGGSTLTIRDVLVGEVWVCSGQSNMEWPLRASERGDEAIQTADHPTLRIFSIPNISALAPVDDVNANWMICTPRTAPEITAVGYYFARSIQSTFDIPIGLIQTDWGGTPAESWTSSKALAPLRDFDNQLALVRKATEDPEGVVRQYEQAIDGWIDGINAVDPGASASVKWFDPMFDDSAWIIAKVPGHWAGDATDFDGLCWYRFAFDLPSEWSQNDATLELGPIDDCDMTWLNGTLVGRVMFEKEGSWLTPRVYKVPASVLRAGRNTLAVRVLDAAGPGGLYGGPKQLFLRSSDGKRAELAGQWRFKMSTPLNSIPKRPLTMADLNNPWTPSALFNGMIAPIAGYRIRGTIWYQGESNRDRAFQYRTLFPAMITDWRTHWGQGDFPFYFVQIAPFAYGGDRGEAAELREAQTLAMRLPNTGMAVTMDIGNAFDIHPANKRDVGERLARWALNRDYGVGDVVVSGPLYKSMTVKGNEIHIAFNFAEGLTTIDGQSPANFVIAGHDQKFVSAQAKIVENVIRVWSSEVKKPVAVRHCWGAADFTNLCNASGLPAPSFRTDEWPMLTRPPGQ